MKFMGSKLIPVREESQRPVRNRRRCARRRVQSPAFMGMNANSTGAALDLYEILDIHEEGMAFQGSTALEPGESFSLSLDLTEPATYIHTSGRVVWSNPAGRTGLRFHKMPASDLGRLRDWLSGSAVEQVVEEVQSPDVPEVLQAPVETEIDAASTEENLEQEIPPTEEPTTAPGMGGVIRPEGVEPKVIEAKAIEAKIIEAKAIEAEAVEAKVVEPKIIEPKIIESGLTERGIAKPDVWEKPEEYASALAATADVGRELEGFTLDLDASLHIVAERTMTLTGATGAAIALSTGEEMICRASAGEDAPPLGARLQAGSGFSGECVQSGKLLYCEDSESDGRVDRESCRALGVRSIMATPIHSPQAVVGLLEIFSPQAHAFGERDKVVLREMAQLVFAAVQRTVERLVDPGEGPGSAGAVPDGPEISTAPVAAEEIGGEDIFPGDTAGRDWSWRKPKLRLIAGGLIMVILVAAIVLMKSGDRTSAAMPPDATAQSVNARTLAQTASTGDLHKLAAAGDADAQFQLGLRYAVGSDVAQDYGEAARWFSAAAEQGHIMAQSNMGAYYWAGRGVDKDLNRAYFWALLAQSGGDEASRVRVPFLASRLSEREILADQKEAEAWFKSHRAHGKPSPAR